LGLLADVRCSHLVLDFHTSTNIGMSAPPLEEFDAGSEVPEWEHRESRDRDEEREAAAFRAAREVGVGEGSCRCYCRCYPTWYRQVRRRGWMAFPLLLPSWFYWCAYIFFGQARAGADGELETCRRSTDGRRGKRIKCAPP